MDGQERLKADEDETTRFLHQILHAVEQAAATAECLLEQAFAKERQSP